jgi:hypothetical protein
VGEALTGCHVTVIELSKNIPKTPKADASKHPLSHGQAAYPIKLFKMIRL